MCCAVDCSGALLLTWHIFYKLDFTIINSCLNHQLFCWLCWSHLSRDKTDVFKLLLYSDQQFKNPETLHLLPRIRKKSYANANPNKNLEKLEQIFFSFFCLNKTKAVTWSSKYWRLIEKQKMTNRWSSWWESYFVFVFLKSIHKHSVFHLCAVVHMVYSSSVCQQKEEQIVS